MVVLLIIFIPKVNTNESVDVQQKAEQDKNIISVGKVDLNEGISGVKVYKENFLVAVINIESIEGYEIIEKIGNGGMAMVYKAKDHILNRNVAVKILRDEFTTDQEFIKRFEEMLYWKLINFLTEMIPLMDSTATELYKELTL